MKLIRQAFPAVIGAMIALFLTQNLTPAIFLIPVALALLVAGVAMRQNRGTRLRRELLTGSPKVIHVHVPQETCNDIRASAAQANITLAQFMSVGLSLATLLVTAINGKGRFIVQQPGMPDEIIDGI